MSEIKDVLVQDHLDKLEKSKFGIDSDSHVYVRTTARGTFTPSGLFTDMRITTMDVSTTAIKIPSVPLANRNSLEIQNLGAETLFVSAYNTVTADSILGTTSGKEIDSGSFWSIDVTEAIEIYGIVATGTVRVKITEVS